MRVPARAPLAVSLLRRAFVALVLAAVAAALGIGVATIAPVDPDMDPQDTFVALLILLAPLLLAAAFDWDAPAPALAAGRVLGARGRHASRCSCCRGRRSSTTSATGIPSSSA